MASESTAFLSVGTRILTKDVMDQIIRSLGNYRTHYASNTKSAMRILGSDKIDVLLLEFELPDTNAFRFISELREKKQYDHLYSILAVDSGDVAVEEIAKELDIQAVLRKPFTAKDVQILVKNFEDLPTQVGSVNWVLKQAKSAFRDKFYVQAGKLYEQALTLAPEDPHVQTEVGKYFLSKPDYPLAQKHLEMALKLRPGFVGAMSALGTLYLRNRNHALAFEYLSQAQRRSPLNPDRAITLTQLHLGWGIEEIKTALMRDPSNAELRFMLGKWYFFQRDYLNALKELRAAALPEGHKDHQEAQILIDATCRLGALK